MKISHILTTRFNLGLYDRENINVYKWIDNRIKLFGKYTLPSVLNQTRQDFIWLMVMDNRTPQDHLVACRR